MTENERLRYLRVDILKKTLEQFGDGINVKKGTLSPIENGKNRITDKMRSLICEKYNVSERWLLYGEGDPIIPEGRRQQLHKWADKVLADSPESFRFRFVNALSQLPDEWWGLTEKAAIDILAEYEPEKADALRSAKAAADRTDTTAASSDVLDTNDGNTARDELHAELDRQLDTVEEGKSKAVQDTASGSFG